MAAPKRKKHERELDCQVISELYLKGLSERDIAEWIGKNRAYTLTHIQIHWDLMEIRRRWRAASIENMAEAKDRHVNSLRFLIKELFVAWEKSKLPAQKTHLDETERIMDLIDQATGKPIMDHLGQKVVRLFKTKHSSASQEGQNGDPRYLALIETCEEQIAKIYGLNSPVRTIVEGPEGGPVNVRNDFGISVDHARRVVEEQIADEMRERIEKEERTRIEREVREQIANERLVASVA